MIDLMGQSRILLADRVVGQLGQMADRIESLEIVHGDIAQILADHTRLATGHRVKPALAVKTSIQTSDFVTAIDQVRTEDGADITVCAGNKNFHDAGFFKDVLGCRQPIENPRMATVDQQPSHAQPPGSRVQRFSYHFADQGITLGQKADL